jgi:hypothetical protein
MLQRYTAFDQYSNVSGLIKQFAEIKVGAERRTFFITANDEIFEMYASDDYAAVKMYPKELSSSDSTEAELLLKRVHCVFHEIKVDGNLMLTDYTDKRSNLVRPVAFEANFTDVSPATPPFANLNNDDTVVNKPIPVEKSKQGTKLGVLLEWNFGGNLNSIGCVVEVDGAIVGEAERGTIFKSRKGSSL